MNKWYFQNDVHACGFSILENVIRNEFKAFHIYIRARKRICSHRIKIITLFPVGDFSLMHLMFNSLDGGKLLVPTFWNWVRCRCCALRPDAETCGCSFCTLFILFIDYHTANYLGSSGLLKVCCWIKVIYILLVKCQLNCVRNALNKNSKLRIRLLEGSGSDYVHWWRLKRQQFCGQNQCHN
jgi:hypothetical protein